MVNISDGIAARKDAGWSLIGSSDGQHGVWARPIMRTTADPWNKHGVELYAGPAAGGGVSTMLWYGDQVTAELITELMTVIGTVIFSMRHVGLLSILTEHDLRK